MLWGCKRRKCGNCGYLIKARGLKQSGARVIESTEEKSRGR